MIRDYKEDIEFVAACKSISIEPSPRQYSKWNNKKGIVYDEYQARRDHLRKMSEEYQERGTSKEQ